MAPCTFEDVDGYRVVLQNEACPLRSPYGLDEGTATQPSLLFPTAHRDREGERLGWRPERWAVWPVVGQAFARSVRVLICSASSGRARRAAGQEQQDRCDREEELYDWAHVVSALGGGETLKEHADRGPISRRRNWRSGKCRHHAGVAEFPVAFELCLVVPLIERRLLGERAVL